MALGQPPLEQGPIVEAGGRATLPFAQWLTALVRRVAPDPKSTGRVFQVPSVAGVPSFTPEVIAGFVPMAYDTANDDLYVYNGSWVKVALS